MAMILEFYFDLASPYAYLGLMRVLPIAQRDAGSIAWCPVDVEELKRAAGNIGPALRHLPAKLRYVQQDAARWARRQGVPLARTVGEPAPRLNRGTFYAADHGLAARYLQLAAHRVWAEAAAPEDDEVLRAIAGDMGWNPQEFLDYTASAQAAERQREMLLRARRAGVFGVPTAVLDDQLWWGNDRLSLAEAALARHSSRGIALHG
jgi:2-hydroxychromene-2-carboxylate isomerase